jgi:hypothetical protein
MTLNEQDKVIEMQARLRASAAVLNEYDRDTREFSGALWGVYDVIGILDGLIETWDEEEQAHSGLLPDEKFAAS